MKLKITKYVKQWLKRGYSEIPDEVPDQLSQECLAPSYKAIAMAILKNDVSLSSLGFSPPKSKWYNELKRLEIQERNATCADPGTKAGEYIM